MEKWVEAAYANSQQVKIAQDNVALAVKEVDRARYGQLSDPRRGRVGELQLPG